MPGYSVPGPGTGAQPAGFGYYDPETGLPASAPPRRRLRVGLIIGIVVAALLAVSVAVHLVVAHSTRGSITLPGTLLGLRKNTSPEALALDHELSRAAAASADGKVLHLVVAIYGDPAGPFFAVGGGGVCGTCAPKSVSAAKQSLHVAGVESFPPGPDGGDLLCAPLAGQGTLGYSCWWFDQTTAGYISGVGYASSLADAAAKTNQIRASVEH